MNMRKDISEVLRSIGVASRFEAMETAIASLRGKKLKTQADQTIPLPDAVNLLESELTGLRLQVSELADKIARYEQMADESLPSMLQIADGFISDMRSASDATLIYDSNWFSRLLLSQAAKQTLARHMYRLVKQYTNSNLDTLRLIGEGDPEMMAIIAKPTDE